MAKDPRVLTIDEVRERLCMRIHHLVTYWHFLPQASMRERLDGLAWSILSTLDGEALDMPGFIMQPRSCPEDEAFYRERGDCWYPSGIDIAGALHEQFTKPSKEETYDVVSLSRV